MKILGRNIGFVRPKKRRFIPTLIGLFITALLAAAYIYKPQPIERVSRLFFDVFQRQFPRDYNPDIPVRIIDIDDESIARIGQWPWPRTIMAELNNKLAEAGAAVVAYDIIFSEADRTSPENMLSVLRDNPDAASNFEDVAELRSHDKIFAESFAQTRVVTGIFLTNSDKGSLPTGRHGFAFSGDNPSDMIDNYAGALHALPLLEEAAAGTGHVSFLPRTGDDGVIRNAPLLGRIGERIFPAISIEALRAAQDARSFGIKSSNASGELATSRAEVASIKVGDFVIPTTPEGELIIHYTLPQPERYIPAWRLLRGDMTQESLETLLAGHIVFIGTGAEGLKDIRTTPIRGGEPGVLIHAQATEQILEGDFLYHPYWIDQIEFLSVILFGLLFALLLPRLTAVRGAILFLFIGNLIYGASYWAFTRYNFIIDPVYPLLSTLGTYVAITLSSFYMAETERSQIRNAFSMYLSPEMVSQVSDNPQLLALGGVEREMTVLFLDIRSFSRISENMRPQDITTFLNLFLTPMTDILQDHKATIDKYIGDAIVAFWNAPLDDPAHEVNAARAVIAMHDALEDLNKRYHKRDDVVWPGDVKMGIGLNTGVCCVGNLGSEQRFSYSMIGDAANLASRIEGLTKQYGVESLIGDSTAQAIPDFALLEADLISVVGRDTAERIHVLAGGRKTADNPKFKKLKSTHKKFLETYRAGDFKAAGDMARQLIPMGEPYDLKRYYTIMSQRMDDYTQTPPPADWGGVFVAREK